MKKASDSLIVLFSILSTINVISVFSQFQPGVYFSKPLLITTLAIWFFLETKKRATHFSRMILAGLLFSIVGDTLLMLVKPESQHFFLLGLASFLFAHLCYIIGFSRYPSIKKGIVWQQPLLTIPFLIFLVAFTSFLWNDLTGLFKFPVVIYASVIILMATSSLNMNHRVTTNAFKILFIGALLFVVSDSIIALKKFKFPSDLEITFNLAVMITYLTGQYFIAKGSIRANNEMVQHPSQTVPRL